MKYSISSTRGWSFNLSVIYPFNLPTTIWNVGWGEFVLWVTTPESVTLVVSSWFTIPYVVLWLFACSKILSKFSRATVCFTIPLAFSNTRFRDIMRKYSKLSDKQQNQITNVYKLVILFFNILLHFHDQITRSKMSLKTAC